MLQMAHTDASIFDHDVSIGLLRDDRQSIFHIGGGEIEHNIGVARLGDSGCMQTQAPQQAGSAQATLLLLTYINYSACLPTGSCIRQMIFRLSMYVQECA
ncbi:hypothetical protein WI99_15070 [Burkholderia cepacia]|nr:hypothetical protein WI99_15070 [Burkholderia cepacia]